MNHQSHIIDGMSKWILTGFLSFFLILSGCAGEEATKSGPPQSYPYRAVATVGMVGDIVKAVAGDKADVHDIMGVGVDPHTYNASTADVKAMQQADIVFYSGLFLEGKMVEMLRRLGEDGQRIHAVTELIGTDYLIHHFAGTNHPDPHVWMDVQGWMKATQAVEAALVEYDPANKDFYHANTAAYLEKLKQLDEYARQSLASIPTPAPGQKPVLVTAHDAFSYFGRAYGIEVHGIQGISTESEAGLQDIQRLVDLIIQRDVKAVFVETSVAEKYVRSLVDGAAARGKKVIIGGSLFSDAMGQAGTYEGTYIGMIDHNVTIITRALGGDAPEKGMNGKLAN